MANTIEKIVTMLVSSSTAPPPEEVQEMVESIRYPRSAAAGLDHSPSPDSPFIRSNRENAQDLPARFCYYEPIGRSRTAQPSRPGSRGIEDKNTLPQTTVMCIAVPSKIVAIDGETATIDVRGARRQVSLMLLADEASLGDYVLVHAGFAIQRIDPEEGKARLELFEEIFKTL